MKAGYPQIEWVTIIFPIKIVALGYPLFLSLFGQTYMYGSLPTASTFARFYPVIMGLSTHSMKACLIKPHLDERNTCRKPTIDSRDHCLLISTQSTQSTPDCLYPDFGLKHQPFIDQIVVSLRTTVSLATVLQEPWEPRVGA